MDDDIGLTGDGKGEETILRWDNREDGIGDNGTEDPIDEDLVDPEDGFAVGLEVDKKAGVGCEEEEEEEDDDDGGEEVVVERWVVECDGNRRTGVKGVVEDALDSEVLGEYRCS